MRSDTILKHSLRLLKADLEMQLLRTVREVAINGFFPYARYGWTVGKYKKPLTPLEIEIVCVHLSGVFRRVTPKLLANDWQSNKPAKPTPNPA